MTSTVPGHRDRKIDTADPVGTEALRADTLACVTGAGGTSISTVLAPPLGQA